jgi:antitoxin YqcF
LSYSTIGLSDYSIGYEDNSKSLRIELVGACDSKCFPNILATCAFNIINTNFRCSVGTIFLDVVKMYLNNSPMQQEMKFADKNGIGALQELFEDNHINVFDLQRESII